MKQASEYSVEIQVRIENAVQKLLSGNPEHWHKLLEGNDVTLAELSDLQALVLQTAGERQRREQEDSLAVELGWLERDWLYYQLKGTYIRENRIKAVEFKIPQLQIEIYRSGDYRVNAVSIFYNGFQLITLPTFKSAAEWIINLYDSNLTENEVPVESIIKLYNEKNELVKLERVFGPVNPAQVFKNNAEIVRIDITQSEITKMKFYRKWENDTNMYC